MLVAVPLDQDIQNLALVVDRAPPIHAPPADLHDHLVQMPAAGRRSPSPTQVRGDQRAELDHPAPHRLAADLDPRWASNSSTSRMLSVKRKYSQTAIADDIRRKPVPLERDRIHAVAPAAPSFWAIAETS
jgi:hypothetical protein